MNEILADLAKSLRWTHDHAPEFGGDPNRIVIMGHSSGAQLAAYLAIDERPLKAVGLSLAMFKGCVPVDADTFDVPAVIALATANRQAAGKPEPKYGHREIFGGKPELWTDYSATTHVAAGKGIPPFLILYDAAAAPESLFIILIGACVVVPVIVCYSILSYVIFRGKARELRYD